MAGLTETVASFVVRTPSSDIPEIAIDKAKKAITDGIGAILAGVGSDVAPPLLRYVAKAGLGGSSPVLGTGIKAAPELAALANGTLGHALDFDDELRLISGHPTVVMLPPLLASANGSKVSGRALIEAYILGVEVAARIGVAMGQQSHYDQGWHSTGTIGVFGAVAALARLHRVDVATTCRAIGLACSMPSGVRRNFGTMAKPFHAGWAARNALVAYQLASEGFTAAPDALEARVGFFAVYGNERSRPELAAERLGQPYAVVDPGIGLKRYPCCYGVHRAVDGMLMLRERYGLTPGITESVLATVPPGGLAPLIYTRPDSGLQGKFCMEYALAASILDGRLDFKSFTDDAVKRPEIVAMLPRIRAVEDARVSPDDPLGRFGSLTSRGFVEIRVTTTAGETHSVQVNYPRGAPENELSWDEVGAKFRECAAFGKVDERPAATALKILSALERCPDVAELLRVLQ